MLTRTDTSVLRSSMGNILSPFWVWVDDPYVFTGEPGTAEVCRRSFSSDLNWSGEGCAPCLDIGSAGNCRRPRPTWRAHLLALGRYRWRCPLRHRSFPRPLRGVDGCNSCCWQTGRGTLRNQLIRTSALSTPRTIQKQAHSRKSQRITGPNPLPCRPCCRTGTNV